MERSAAALVRTARKSSGLTIRALAERAGVAATTITRIESAMMDPTVGTLTAIITATGRRLRLEAPSQARVRLADLADAWQRRHGEDRPDWTRLRALLAHLSRHPDEIDDAIHTQPAASGSALHDTLLAGIADHLADTHHLTRPAWTSAVPPLHAETFLMPTTPRQRQTIRAVTPPQLAARNLAIDTNSLWRNGMSIGA